MRTTIIKEYKSPGRQECMEALADFGTPENVIGHCKAVGAVGYTLGQAFDRRRKEPVLDLDLILAAGLLHDIARVEDKHWEAGADYCLCRGWSREAEIIRVHMTYDPFNRAEDFNETDIVCLADRIVLEDRYAGLERRMDYIVEKARRQGNEHHVPIILQKKEEVGRLIEDIEDYLGESLDSLMENIDYQHPEE